MLSQQSKEVSTPCPSAPSSTAVGALHSTSSALSGSRNFLQPSSTVLAANLELLVHFFDIYPEYVDRIFLFASRTNWSQTGAERTCAGVSVPSSELCTERRGSTYLCQGDSIRTLRSRIMQTYRKKWGRKEFVYIGLSTADAETIRRAHNVRSFFLGFLYAYQGLYCESGYVYRGS